MLERADSPKGSRVKRQAGPAARRDVQGAMRCSNLTVKVGQAWSVVAIGLRSARRLRMSRRVAKFIAPGRNLVFREAVFAAPEPLHAGQPACAQLP